MKKLCVITFAAVVLGAMAPSTSFAQNTPAVGIGVKAGSLGIGIQGAVRVAPRVAVRGGFNFFNYSHTFDQDGTAYDAKLKLQSIEAALDLGVGGGVRFSPGLLLRNNNHLDAILSVPGGQTFTLGGTTYQSQSGTPLGGTGLIDFKKVAPVLGIGFGSLVPRSDRHFTAVFDLGVVFEGQPKVALALSGNACLVNPNGSTGQCSPVNSLPGVAANIADEQVKVGNDLKILKLYPVVSFGVGWKF
jgi:hypothetical protein